MSTKVMIIHESIFHSITSDFVTMGTLAAVYWSNTVYFQGSIPEWILWAIIILAILSVPTHTKRTFTDPKSAMDEVARIYGGKITFTDSDEE